MAALARGLFLLFLLLAATASRAEPAGVDEALQALDAEAPEQRRMALLWLAREGLADQAAQVLPSLHDTEADIRALAEHAVWRMWSRSGDAAVDAALRAGIHDLEQGLTARALDAFTRVIELRPDFAEGWNKRATAYYLMGDLEQSERDAQETLRRLPQHFGALSGVGLIEIRRGRPERALPYFERALEVNPNMDGARRSIELILQRLGRGGRHAT